MLRDVNQAARETTSVLRQQLLALLDWCLLHVCDDMQQPPETVSCVTQGVAVLVVVAPLPFCKTLASALCSLSCSQSCMPFLSSNPGGTS
jgi:hypothetical protein